MIRNWYSFTGFIVQLYLLVTFTYLIFRQYGEVRRPRNGFTRLRWYLLTIFIISFLSINLRTPVVYWSMLRPSSSAPYFSAVGSLATSALLFFYGTSWLLISTYKERR